MNVEALVFDLFGTLVDIGSVEAACADVTPDPKAFVALWRQKQLEYSWLRALMGRYEDFWAVTAAALDFTIERSRVDAGDAPRRRLLEAWLTGRPYPETAAALARLSPRPLAVLSNGTPDMLDRVLRSAGLRDRFAHVISVDEVRTYKPAPEVYAMAERHLSLPRAQLLFVSSNAWDVAGRTRVRAPGRVGEPGRRAPGEIGGRTGSDRPRPGRSGGAGDSVKMSGSVDAGCAPCYKTTTRCAITLANASVHRGGSRSLKTRVVSASLSSPAITNT